MADERNHIADGLDTLRSELSLAEIMRLIERTARWVSPKTFEILPVWYPEHRRRGLFYKNDWAEPQMNTNRQTGETTHKYEGNLYANKALTHALGLRSKERPNWSCCHIWGVDDDRYSQTNLVVQDARFYSCVANMVLLPTPLKAFTDVMPRVKMMLRACAFYTFGWYCDIESFPRTDWSETTNEAWYPQSWPTAERQITPPGTMDLDNRIATDIARRRLAIKRDLELAGPFYPSEQVKSVLDYWNINLEI